MNHALENHTIMNHTYTKWRHIGQCDGIVLLIAVDPCRQSQTWRSRGWRRRSLRCPLLRRRLPASHGRARTTRRPCTTRARRPSRTTPSRRQCFGDRRPRASRQPLKRRPLLRRCRYRRRRPPQRRRPLLRRSRAVVMAIGRSGTAAGGPATGGATMATGGTAAAEQEQFLLRGFGLCRESDSPLLLPLCKFVFAAPTGLTLWLEQAHQRRQMPWKVSSRQCSGRQG